MFAIRRDFDFEGLRVPTDDPAPYPNPLAGGRNNELHQVFMM